MSRLPDGVLLSDMGITALSACCCCDKEHSPVLPSVRGRFPLECKEGFQGEPIFLLTKRKQDFNYSLLK